MESKSDIILENYVSGWGGVSPMVMSGVRIVLAITQSFY